jgi:ParB family transcriptional regulator, chromosome partitioning protein
MTTSNAAVDTADKTGPAKISEKLAEKRRALGRGLESLLPGPRAVAVAPTLPQSARKDGAPDSSSSQSPVLSSQNPLPSSDGLDGRAGTAVAPLKAAVAGALDQLQAVASGQAADGEDVFRLQLDQIADNPHQTRREFDRAALAELAESIKAQGVLQPIVVRPGLGNDGRFILILGERRLRASQLAGQTTIPVIVKRVSEQQAAEMTLVENLQRADLNCMEQAEAFSDLSTQFHMTQEEIGKRVGVSREQVSNYMRLLSLPEGVIGALQKGTLQYSHARTLLQLRDHVQIWKLAQKVIAEKMSVAKLEDLIQGVSMPSGLGQAKADGRARWVDPNVKAAQRSMEEALGMKVRIRDRRGRGKILIEYATLEDFDRVVQMLKGK